MLAQQWHVCHTMLKCYVQFSLLTLLTYLLRYWINWILQWKQLIEHVTICSGGTAPKIAMRYVSRYLSHDAIPYRDTNCQFVLLSCAYKKYN